MNFSHDVCIVGLKCYDLLSGVQAPRYLGGVEKQLVSLARALRQAGKRVSFITYDHGQPDGQDLDGITVFTSFDSAGGYPVVRFVHPRMTRLWAAMRRASAAIYLQMGAGVETGQVALGCCKQRKFVYLVASDADCEPSLPFLQYGRERLFYRHGLRAADLVIAQTVRQQALLRSSFDCSSQVIPLPCSWAIPTDRYQPPSPPAPGGAQILWVGRIIEAKRLEWLLDAASQYPDLSFDVVGTPNTESVYYLKLCQVADRLRNVTMHGKVSSELLDVLYRKASLLCCTSEVEGFPTTFLEAWNYGLPVLTTFDPDGVVRSNEIGWIADTQEEFLDKLRRLICSPDEWVRLSQRARQYFCDHYTADALMPRYLQLFDGLLGSYGNRKTT